MIYLYPLPSAGVKGMRGRVQLLHRFWGSKLKFRLRPFAYIVGALTPELFPIYLCI